MCRNKKRMLILFSSDSEDERTDIASTSQNVMSEIEIDGTQWVKLKAGGSRSETPVPMIFKDIAGSTDYTKRNIISGCVTSAFELIIDRHIMGHIKDCTETEAHRVLKKDWTITVAELRSFLRILYARGAYKARSLKASERLQTDKFALISEIWNRFISNSQACYKPYENISIDEQLFPTKARCRFTQYMPNKPHKSGIKFWLAVDAQTKYILNSIPYIGKDETRCSKSLGEFVILKLAEPYLQ